jgi:hypothetical protein
MGFPRLFNQTIPLLLEAAGIALWNIFFQNSIAARPVFLPF